MGKTKINTVGEESTPTAGVKKQKPSKKETKVHLSGLKGGQRIKVVEADLPAEALAQAEPASMETSARQRQEHHRGKKYLEARAKVDPKKTYTVSDAAKLLKETSTSKFNGSVELHLVLVKDSINSRVELPYSTGKIRKVEVASDETVEKLKAGKIDFDVLLASPDMMPKLVPFAKLLGPKGLMPNPKNGTLVADPRKSVESFSGNHIMVKTEKTALLTHNVVAKVGQPEKEIEENLAAVIKNVGEKNVKKAIVAASMGPGINIAI